MWSRLAVGCRLSAVSEQRALSHADIGAWGVGVGDGSGGYAASLHSPPPAPHPLRVQLVIQRLADFAAENVHQILCGSLLHTGDAAESFDEQATALLADAGHVIERAVKKSFRPAAAMRRDREAMRFIAHHLQQLQRGIAALQADRILALGDVDLLLALGQAGDRDLLDAELVQRRQ